MMPALLIRTFSAGYSFAKLRGHGANARRIVNIQRDGLHPGIGARGLVQHLLAPSRDDDLIAQGVKLLRQSAPDAGTAAA